ncbi:uncharacterized protein [Amphiura filiformis]|uniref:uncharacterized protein n=1 Tax=Amphiura filiformis TaxID=82378 RepID=UPI003B21282C
MQKDIDNLLEWSRTWLLKFNTAKCKVMHMGYNNPGGSYTMNGAALEEIEIWNPGLKKDITTLEKVQRRATKLVPELKDLQYEERLEALGLFTLEMRRLRCDLMEVHKIMNGLEKVNADKFFQLVDEHSSTRGHNKKIFKPRLHKGLRCRKDFFTHRVIEEWNNLPQQVINALTVTSFKHELQNYWQRYGDIKASA